MPILIELLPIFLPLILECINKEGKEKTKINLRSAGPLIQFKIYRTARKNGATRCEARTAVKEAVTALRDATDDDIEFLINETSVND